MTYIICNLFQPVVPLIFEKISSIDVKSFYFSRNSEKHLKINLLQLDLTKLYLSIKYLFLLFRKVYKNNKNYKYIILTQPPLIGYLFCIFFPRQASNSIHLVMDLYPHLLAPKLFTKDEKPNFLAKFFLNILLKFKRIVFIGKGPSYNYCKKIAPSKVLIIRNTTKLAQKENSNTYRRDYRVSYCGSFNSIVDLSIFKKYEQLFSSKPFSFRKHIKNSNPLGKISDKKLSKFLSLSKFGFIILKKSISDFATPSKVISYLSHGLPILYYGPENNDVAYIIKKYKCGFFLNGSNKGLTKRSIRKMTCDKEYNHLKKNATFVYNALFSQEKILLQWQKILN
jgi:hypothetical protein